MGHDIPEDVFGQWTIGFEQQIRSAVSSGRDLNSAIDYIATQQKSEWVYNPDLLTARLEALETARVRYQDKLARVRYLQRSTVRFGRESWYAGPATDADNWNELRRRLSIRGRSEDEILMVDEESTTVVSLLDNPGQSKFSTRGLVVGHIQSGKTGNIAAVIAKASDTPYKFFLVLAGMTDSLRNQTQHRLEADVVDAARARWYGWTACDVDYEGTLVKGDFQHPAAGGFAFDTRNQLAVIKKNAGVLRRFLAKLKTTDAATLQATPFLVIDDECDQASVNSAPLQAAMTRINGYIREILQRLPRVAYVGYSATPFANVLIDPRVDPANSEDLYPRSFIHALRRPDAYFGAERLFGRSAIDGEHGDASMDGLDMVRVVPSDEIPLMRPSSGGAGTFRFTVAPSLQQAIRYFVMVTAARVARGQEGQHSTMLVHTSVLNSVHRSAAEAIRAHLEVLCRRLSTGDRALTSELLEQWTREQDSVLSEQFDLAPVAFPVLAEHLSQVAASIEVVVENWSSTRRIDYSEAGRRYLVIGGNVLARGLTLEGLSVSVFLRSSSQYDTLMQMGRWFGYRSGYEDLPRVWMENSVYQSFLDLAAVEAEIRRDILRYAEEEITPQSFAVRIRRLPGMTITAPSKMRNVQTVQIGYAGSHHQTTRFYRHDAGWLQANWDAGARLADGQERAEPRNGNKILRDVPVSAVAEFLDSYRTHESHKPMARELLRDYLTRENDKGRLLRWNIGIIGGGTPDAAEIRFGRRGGLGRVHRSALKGGGDQACIKALMSRSDLLVDTGPTRPVVEDTWESLKRMRLNSGLPPLLLLYLIDRESAPARSGEAREPLAAVHDVLGMGIVFPGEDAAAQVYVSARLEPEEAIETPEGEDAPPGELLDTANGES